MLHENDAEWTSQTILQLRVDVLAVDYHWVAFSRISELISRMSFSMNTSIGQGIIFPMRHGIVSSEAKGEVLIKNAGYFHFIIKLVIPPALYLSSYLIPSQGG